MKTTAKKILLIGTALILLGGQSVFAADQTSDRTRDRNRDQTCINDGSGSQIKNSNQNRKMNQIGKMNKAGNGSAQRNRRGK